MQRRIIINGKRMDEWLVELNGAKVLACSARCQNGVSQGCKQPATLANPIDLSQCRA
jgi:hypothetical protein